MPLRVTKKPWFGPKQTLGWGWRPVSWEGWLVTGVFLALIPVSVTVWPGVQAAIAVAVLIGLLLAITLLTGDPPG
jgi:ABC-type uncharacterized transport system permease subunit